MPEKAKWGPSAPVWNQSFPSPGHCNDMVQCVKLRAVPDLFLFQSDRSQILPDLEWRVKHYKCTSDLIFWLFFVQQLQLHHLHTVTHSRSNLCHNNVSSMYYVSNFIFDREKSIRYSRPRISNVWEKSTFQIWQNYPAPVGFLPELDFCWI